MTEPLRLYRVRHNGADTLMWLSDEHAQTYGTDAILADEPADELVESGGFHGAAGLDVLKKADEPDADEKARVPANKSRVARDK